MRSAVSELSRALAHLFEMVRAERQSQRVKISALERDLHAAREQLAALGVEPQAAPAPNDFDQLRAAAERLRLRTEQLVRDAHLSSPVPTPPNEDETVASPAQADAPVVDGAPALRVLGESPRSAVAVESELAVDEPEQEPARPEAKAAEAVAVPVARTPAPAALSRQRDRRPVLAQSRRGAACCRGTARSTAPTADRCAQAPRR